MKFLEVTVRKLREFFMIPERESYDFPFVECEVAQLHRLQQAPGAAVIDDVTWKDMMVDGYLATLSREVSIFGQQKLYQRLRQGGGQSAEAVRRLMAQPERMSELKLVCKPLRLAETEIATLLHKDAAPVPPSWAGKTWPLPILLLVSFAAIIWSPLAWLASAAIGYFLVSRQLRHHRAAAMWSAKAATVQLLLRVCHALGGDDAAHARKLARALERSPVVRGVPGLMSYMDWLMLENVNHYFASAARVHAELPFLRACFERVSSLEADLALASHLEGVPQFCWSSASASSMVSLTATVHPLLPQAQPLTLAMRGRGVFISGQNGIGKSTLLRTLGLNLLTARAFGFCYAQQAVVPDLPVYSSMQTEDSLLGGESLYMAELRRARELLAAADGPHPGICIIDEIFRGTNHLESVSAAAAVIDALARRGLVVVSSHNLVLAPLLAHRIDPLCVSRADDGTLVLAPGVLAHTNGIALLAERDFGPAVEANAGRVFDWLSGYLAHPADCSGVLAS